MLKYGRILFLCWVLHLGSSLAELYTALTDMEVLLHTEQVLLDSLQNYISRQEVKLEILKKRSDRYKLEHKKAARDPHKYLSNPVNVYLLVKRLTSDWKETDEFMKLDPYEEMMRNITMDRPDVIFPSDEDLNGAATALLRLQDTYNLDTASLARGELNGIPHSIQLSSDDCFELGRQSYLNNDFRHTILWMNEALTRHDMEQNNTDTVKWEILEYLAFSIFKEGDVKTAYILTQKLLSLYPDHPRALGNLQHYQKHLQADASGHHEEESLKETDEYSFIKAKYELLCRRGMELSETVKARLKCRYSFKNPFLKLAPLKEEEAFLNPRILLYREALYPREIEIVKNLAQPRLHRATVQNYVTGALESTSYRISKSAWLKNSEHEAIATISQRVEDITSLSMESAEELQVVNYGIGGHYEPHYDFARKGEPAFEALQTGNRIATVLFYMNTVVQGGATVFPHLNLSIWPEMGTAAFWMNLHSSGVGDYLTRHAACPVLEGTKWVCNKWLHEKGQEFLRPCHPNDKNWEWD